MKHNYFKNIDTLLLLKVLVIIGFISLMTTVYLFTSDDKERRKDAVLQEQLTNLNNTYKVSMNRIEIISDTINSTVFNQDDILKLLYKAKNTTDAKSLIPIRERLYNSIKPHFDNLKKVGVIIMLFSFENNKTFLRVHKPNKFNDDLSKVRYSFKYVNEHKKIIRGLEEGKIMHAFRNIYPLYYKGEYLGSVDIAFSSEVLLTHMKNLYKTESHFIINKNVFMTNIWKMKDMVYYIPSIEHQDFLQNSHSKDLDTHVIRMEEDINHKLKDKIYENIEHKNAFSLEDSGRIISFLPVKDIRDKKTIAYLVSYIDSEFLKNLVKEHILINILAFIVLLVVALVIYINIKKHLIDNIGLLKEVKDTNKAFKIIFEKASDGIIIIEENNIIECNEAILKMLGYSRKNQLIGEHISLLSHIFDNKMLHFIEDIQESDKAKNFQRMFTNADSQKLWVSVTFSVIIISKKHVVHALIKDITKQKQHEEELLEEKNILNFKATHDLLTMLPNRTLFMDRLTQAIATSQKDEKSFAVMFLDLNKFKPINDTLGHLVGDKVLQHVSKKLQSIIREEDTLARLGGDEFVILMQNLKLIEDASRLANKIVTVLNEPIKIDTHKLNISASIGISIYPHHTTDATQLMEYADIAMYRAKNDTTVNYQFYSL